MVDGTRKVHRDLLWPIRVLIVAGAVLVAAAASSHPPYRRADTILSAA